MSSGCAVQGSGHALDKCFAEIVQTVIEAGQ